MGDHNERLLMELQKKSGNNVCADCGSKSMCFIIILLLCRVFLVKRGISMGWRLGGGRKCVHASEFSDLDVKCIRKRNYQLN